MGRRMDERWWGDAEVLLEEDGEGGEESCEGELPVVDTKRSSERSHKPLSSFLFGNMIVNETVEDDYTALGDEDSSRSGGRRSLSSRLAGAARDERSASQL